MNILYEDKDIIVVEKPAGVPVQTKSITERDLVNGLKGYLNKEKGINDPYIGTIHRLDRPVHGILVFALNKKAAAELSRQLVCGGFNKKYHALVEGTVDTKGEERLLENYLIKNRDNTAQLSDRNEKKARAARLKYRSIRTDAENNVTLLDIELITGRFHQIRVQMAGTGHPVAGDVKYGASRIDTDLYARYFNTSGAVSDKGYSISGNASICLSAYSLGFMHPSDGKRMEFMTEEPAFS